MRRLDEMRARWQHGPKAAERRRFRARLMLRDPGGYSS